MTTDKQTGFAFLAVVAAGVATAWLHHINGNGLALLMAIASVVAWSVLAGAYLFGRPSQEFSMNATIFATLHGTALGVAGDIQLMGLAYMTCAFLGRVVVRPGNSMRP